MIPFVYPETHAWLTNFLFLRYIPRTLRFVDRIVTVSEASKRDILRFYPRAAEKVVVIPEGVSPDFAPAPPAAIAAARQRYGIDAPYILTLGALQERKNLATLFAAFRAIRERGFAPQLVVVGRKVWKAEGIEGQLRAERLGAEVIFTGHVPDDDLPALYSGATAFAFPSLYEGFGLPPLEAMACGTPVVASDSSSLPEVVGGAGLLIPPRDAGGFADALARLLTDEALHRACRERDSCARAASPGRRRRRRTQRYSAPRPGPMG